MLVKLHNKYKTKSRPSEATELKQNIMKSQQIFNIMAWVQSKCLSNHLLKSEEKREKIIGPRFCFDKNKDDNLRTLSHYV